MSWNYIFIGIGVTPIQTTITTYASQQGMPGVKEVILKWSMEGSADRPLPQTGGTVKIIPMISKCLKRRGLDE
jgi:hypothetical protein